MCLYPCKLLVRAGAPLRRRGRITQQRYKVRRRRRLCLLRCRNVITEDRRFRFVCNLPCVLPRHHEGVCDCLRRSRHSSTLHYAVEDSSWTRSTCWISSARLHRGITPSLKYHKMCLGYGTGHHFPSPKKTRRLSCRCIVVKPHLMSVRMCF